MLNSVDTLQKNTIVYTIELGTEFIFKCARLSSRELIKFFKDVYHTIFILLH